MAAVIKRATSKIPFVSGFIKSTRNLFFVKRRPKWKMGKEWVRPPAEQYKESLHWEGFIVPEYWTEDDLSQYPQIQQDLRDLEEYLLPIFWDFNQKAKYYQNNFYKYQWVFMFGAFLTTILAVLAGYYGGISTESARFIIISAPTQRWVELFGLVTTIVSGITTFYTFLSSQGDPRKRWASYRRLTEEMRMTYFKYVSHSAPYDCEDRVDKLRKHVLEVRRQEQENG